MENETNEDCTTTEPQYSFASHYNDLLKEILIQNAFIRNKFQDVHEVSDINKHVNHLRNHTSSISQDIRYLYDAQDRMMGIMDKMLMRLDSIEERLKRLSDDNEKSATMNENNQNYNQSNETSSRKNIFSNFMRNEKPNYGECFEFSLPMPPALFARSRFPMEALLHKMSHENASTHESSSVNDNSNVFKCKSPVNIEEITDLSSEIQNLFHKT